MPMPARTASCFTVVQNCCRLSGSVTIRLEFIGSQVGVVGPTLAVLMVAAVLGAIADAERYLAEGQFPAGSMGPKVEAACRFAELTGNLGRFAVASLSFQ